MNHSENINELASALAKAQGTMQNAKKKAENPFFRSAYADLASVWDTIRKPLSDNGLSVSQGTAMDGDNISLETLLLHTSGQWVSSSLPVRPVKQDPQGVGSAVTYMRRYGLMAIVGIAAEAEDDDGNTAIGSGHNPESKTKVEPKAEPKKEELFPASRDEKVELAIKAAKTQKQVETINARINTLLDTGEVELEKAKAWRKLCDAKSNTFAVVA